MERRIHYLTFYHFQVLLSNLTTNLWHELKVRGASRSIYNDSVVYKGDFSDSQKILLRLNCDQILASTVVHTDDGGGIGLELSAGMIAGGACVTFALVLGILAIALWRKYFNESYYYLDESPSTPAPSIVPDWDIERPSSTTTSLGGGSSTGSSSGTAAATKTAIPAHLFIRHVAGLHADSDIGFSKEYEAIQAMSPQEEFPADSSYLEDNKVKNRYHNVVACKCLSRTTRLGDSRHHAHSCLPSFLPPSSFKSTLSAPGCLPGSHLARGCSNFAARHRRSVGRSVGL